MDSMLRTDYFPTSSLFKGHSDSSYASSPKNGWLPKLIKPSRGGRGMRSEGRAIGDGQLQKHGRGHEVRVGYPRPETEDIVVEFSGKFTTFSHHIVNITKFKNKLDADNVAEGPGQDMSGLERGMELLFQEFSTERAVPHDRRQRNHTPQSCALRYPITLAEPLCNETQMIFRTVGLESFSCPKSTNTNHFGKFRPVSISHHDHLCPI